MLPGTWCDLGDRCNVDADEEEDDNIDNCDQDDDYSDDKVLRAPDHLQDWESQEVQVDSSQPPPPPLCIGKKMDL